MTTVKNPEFILAVINSPALEEVTLTDTLNASTFADLIKNDLVIAQRTMLETCLSVRQIIPYITISKMIDGVEHVCVYQRTKKVGEQRLAGKYSIGFGGHMEHRNLFISEEGVVNPIASIINTAHTEIAEELAFIDPNGAEYHDYEIGFISKFLIDSVDDVAKVHLGVLMGIIIPENYRVVCREEELKMIGFYPVTGLNANKDLNFENWSQLYLDYLNDTPKPMAHDDSKEPGWI
jgi:predicted NUDIX family phosphoesterase